MVVFMKKQRQPKWMPPEPPSVEVIRLETADGFGIYRSVELPENRPSFVDLEKSVWFQVTQFHDSSVHPSPSVEFSIELDMWPEFMSAFANVEQYRKWVFNPYWRRAFAERGVKMVTYKVQRDEVKFGRTQVLFNKHFAKKIKEEPLSQYL